MDKSCPFWSDDRECASRECGIENCDDKVPSGLRQHVSHVLFHWFFLVNGMH